MLQRALVEHPPRVKVYLVPGKFHSNGEVPMKKMLTNEARTRERRSACHLLSEVHLSFLESVSGLPLDTVRQTS